MSHLGGQSSTRHTKSTLGSADKLQAARNLIREYVRREQLEQQVDQEEFDLINSDGVIIGPQAWPSGVTPNTRIELLLWHGHADGGAQLPPGGRDAANARNWRQQDVGQQADQLRLRAEDAGRREEDARRREDDARRREDDARRREDDAQRHEQQLERRERDVLEREQNIQPRRNGAAPSSDDLPSGGEKESIRTDLARIRECQSCLSFFACRTRLGNYCR